MSHTADDSPPDGWEPPGAIEVGATDDTLRLWKAREAVRHAELRLTAQATIRVALEARATALTGWGAVGLLATAAGLFASIQHKDTAGALGAGVAAAVLLYAGWRGIHAVRPRAWDSPGYAPAAILDDPHPSEMEAQEAIAGDLGDSITKNTRRLNQTGNALRKVGLLLTLAPLAGAAAYCLADPIISVWAALRPLYATWWAWALAAVGLVSSP